MSLLTTSRPVALGAAICDQLATVIGHGGQPWTTRGDSPTHFAAQLNTLPDGNRLPIGLVDHDHTAEDLEPWTLGGRAMMVPSTLALRMGVETSRTLPTGSRLLWNGRGRRDHVAPNVIVKINPHGAMHWSCGNNHHEPMSGTFAYIGGAGWVAEAKTRRSWADDTTGRMLDDPSTLPRAVVSRLFYLARRDDPFALNVCEEMATRVAAVLSTVSLWTGGASIVLQCNPLSITGLTDWMSRSAAFRDAMGETTADVTVLPTGAVPPLEALGAQRVALAA